MKMRSVTVSDNNLEVTQTTKPAPKQREVLVKVAAFGVNRADLLQREGKYPPPKGASDILGLEISGEVVSCGDGCDSGWVGKPVAAMLSGGGYAEYAVVPQDHLIPVPDSIPLTEFAGIPEVYLTAIQSLVFTTNLHAGQKVLMHAGASGLGSAVIQLSKVLGADVAVTCSTAKVDFCYDLGADIVIDYKNQSFVDALKNKQFFPDLILDVVGGEYLNGNINIVNQDGAIVQLAMISGRYSEPVDLARILSKRVNIHGSTLRNRDDGYKARLVEYFQQEVLALFEQKRLNSCIDKVFSVDDIESAHQMMRNNQSKGKLVVYW